MVILTQLCDVFVRQHDGLPRGDQLTTWCALYEDHALGSADNQVVAGRADNLGDALLTNLVVRQLLQHSRYLGGLLCHHLAVVINLDDREKAVILPNNKRVRLETHRDRVSASLQIKLPHQFESGRGDA